MVSYGEIDESYNIGSFRLHADILFYRDDVELVWIYKIELKIYACIRRFYELNFINYFWRILRNFVIMSWNRKNYWQADLTQVIT